MNEREKRVFIRVFLSNFFKDSVEVILYAAVAQPGTARVSNFKELTRFRKDIPVQIWAAAFQKIITPHPKYLNTPE